MLFNTIKNDVHAGLSSEKPRKAYEPPTLMPLESVDVASGSSNVPEANNGLLES